MDPQHTLIILGGFAVIALAAHRIGAAFALAKLPLITGFLVAGVLTGPFVLGLVPRGAGTRLFFLDEIALAFIGFAAGGELHIKELKSRLKSIRWITAGLVFATFTCTVVAVLLLKDLIPFLRELPTVELVAVAILAGSILVARSPSSAIAVISELRARGTYTRTVLGVTVIMDVVVIVLFAICSDVSDAITTQIGFDLSLPALLLGELLLALVAGLLLAVVLKVVLSLPLPEVVRVLLLLAAGFGTFRFSHWLRHDSAAHLPFEILLEPLLVSMIAGIAVANSSRHRVHFLEILERTGPTVYVMFFTLVGATMRLDVLAEAWPFALTLFVVRILALYLGSSAGSLVAGDPKRLGRIYWMGFVTHAGVALGLAREVEIEFPGWGASLSAVIVAVVVMNQLAGPPLFKWALHLAGEAHERGRPEEWDGVRDVIVFGLEDQSVALAWNLAAHGWEVKLATRRPELVREEPGPGLTIHPIEDLSQKTLEDLEAGKAEAVVVMLEDDENLLVCELAYEHYGTRNLVVRLNDATDAEKFHQLGARVVHEGAAMVGLLSQCVRSPSAATLFLGQEPGEDVEEYTLRNEDLVGLEVRELKLPLDTLILSIHREGQAIRTHGFTRLEYGDEVTLVGSQESLEKLALRFDG